MITQEPETHSALIEHVRSQMMSRGWCIVETAHLLEGWECSINPVFDGRFSDTWYYEESEIWARWVPDIDNAQSAPTKYLSFLRELITKALAEENIDLAASEYRTDDPSAIRDQNVTKWHVDGKYVRTICVLNGEPTELLHNSAVIAVPIKQTLIMTARKRHKRTGIRGTQHRRPTVTSKDRKLIITGFTAIH